MNIFNTILPLPLYVCYYFENILTFSYIIFCLSLCLGFFRILDGILQDKVHFYGYGKMACD